MIELGETDGMDGRECFEVDRPSSLNLSVLGRVPLLVAWWQKQLLNYDLEHNRFKFLIVVLTSWPASSSSLKRIFGSFAVPRNIKATRWWSFRRPASRKCVERSDLGWNYHDNDREVDYIIWKVQYKSEHVGLLRKILHCNNLILLLLTPPSCLLFALSDF